MLRNIFSLSLSLFLLCSLASAQTTGLDVNDVSFLLPMKDGRPFPEINLEAQNLIPSKIYGQVIHFENPGTPIEDLPYIDVKEISKLSNWFVTSTRLDHCGEVFELNDLIVPSNGGEILLAQRREGCQPRLRIVAQPFNSSNQPVGTALHILFKLDEEKLGTFARGLLELKDVGASLGFSTTGLPLSVHPALLQEAKAGRTVLSSMLKELIEKTASSSPLEIVTLSVRSEVNHWKMVAGYVQNGSWRRFVTDFSKQFYTKDEDVLMGVEDIDCDQLSICVSKPAYRPLELSPSGTIVTEIFQNTPEMRRVQVPGQRTHEIHVKAEVLDNPSRTHFFNTNCLSCHQSSNLRDRDLLNTEFQSSPGITPFVQKKYLSEQTNGVLNFAYFGRIPRISSRTAADSVVVANALNQLLGRSNPAPFIKDLNQYWNCVVSQNDIQKCSQTME